MALVYGVGLLSFFCADFLTAKYGDDQLVANWAALKASLFMTTSFALLGLDQVMVRNPNHSKRLFGLAAFQGVTIGVITACVLVALLFLQFSFMTILAFGLFPLLQATAAYFRSRNELLLAQIATNGWRIMFGILVFANLWLATGIEYSGLLCAALLVGIGAVAIISLTFPTSPRPAAEDSESGIADYYLVGLRFAGSLVVLNASINIEQLLLNFQNNTGASALYFRFCTVFLFPVSAICGLVGFVAGPMMRERADSAVHFAMNYAWAVWVGVIVVALANVAVAWFAVGYVIGSEENPYKLPLAIIVGTIGAMRLLLIFPSAFLGVFADRNLLDRFVAISALGLVGMVLVYLLMTNMFGMPPVLAIGIASAVNWFTRVAVGWLICFAICRSRGQNNLFLSTASGFDGSRPAV